MFGKIGLLSSIAGSCLEVSVAIVLEDKGGAKGKEEESRKCQRWGRRSASYFEFGVPQTPDLIFSATFQGRL